MTARGMFYGIGVGPGPMGLLPVAAVNALQDSEVIFLPRAGGSEQSISAGCLAGLNILPEKFREIEFSIDSERSDRNGHYDELARQIAIELSEGRTVSYVTIGDALTYSTYSYTLQALLKRNSDFSHCTIPGITSYCAAASMFDWPLGQGKERVLILPCPDNMEELWNDIVSHDIVVLMKIGKRMNMVLQLLRERCISKYCALARRIGLSGQLLCPDLSLLDVNGDGLGSLSTMLIRRQP